MAYPLSPRIITFNKVLGFWGWFGILLDYVQILQVSQRCSPNWPHLEPAGMKLPKPSVGALARATCLFLLYCEMATAKNAFFDFDKPMDVITPLLNAVILAGALFLFVPQILKIHASKSVAGLSEISFILQVKHWITVARNGYAAFRSLCVLCTSF